jgi:hypothetical protein
VPASYNVKRVFRGALGADETRFELTGAVNEGQLIVNYTGHGSMRVWGHDALLLTADDIRDSWRNNARLPFVVAMNCLNGFFHEIYDVESLAETFLRAPQGGAIATWASSGLTLPGPQAQVNKELFRLLFTRTDLTVGEAVAAAKRVVTDRDVRRSWIFFGDPALRLRGVEAVSVVTDGASAAAIGVANIPSESATSADEAQQVAKEFDESDVHLADLTGDGRDDVWLYAPETGWQVFAARLNDDAAADLFFYRRRTGDWVTGMNVNAGAGPFAFRSGRWTPELQILVSDLNADGRDDVVAYDPLTGATVLASPDKTGTFAERRLAWPSFMRLHAGDINADGLRDIVGYETRTGRGFVALNGKKDFTITESMWGAGWQLTIADLNDDVRNDLVLYDPLSGSARVAVSEARGGFKFETRAWTAGLSLRAADLTGDGRHGLFGYSADSGVWLTSTQTKRGWSEQTGVWAPGRHVAIGDVNGDGRDDVVTLDSKSGAGARCVTVAPGVFDCQNDSWAPARLFIGRAY